MDGGRLLESATHKTLHAHSFSRSSTQASFVLTDLLSRYLTLLASTCAKYAQHAGRSGITARDAISALDELGVSVEELREYCASEANELGRYAVYSARRVEDMTELKAYVSNGLRQDRDDAFPLHYAPLPESLEESDHEEDSADDDDEFDVDNPSTIGQSTQPFILDDMDVDYPRQQSPTEMRGTRRQSTPPLPLSPVSNPSSPRKRQRTSKWQPPEYVPDFLPPFPTHDDLNEPLNGLHSPGMVPLMQPPPPKIDKPPSPAPQALATSSTTSSDYFTQVPYAQSSLAPVSEWHLPSARIPFASTSSAQASRSSVRLPTPQTEPALLKAYHHILTNTTPSNANANPARHRVAMALLFQTQVNPRWDPPDTLFSSVAPCQPRVAVIGPTAPVPEGKPSATAAPNDVAKLPAAPPRPVSNTERLTPLLSQQPSRIPELARHILPPAILTRTTRLAHPPVLSRGTKKLYYGNGIPAPWNANAQAIAAATPATPANGKGKEPQPNGRSKEPQVKPALQDARMFATWDYETKNFKEPLAPTRRARLGSQAGGSGTALTLSLGGRARNGSKHG